jgi:hypothetical protein
MHTDSEHHAAPKNHSDWVRCPVCGEEDMRKTSDEEGNALIHCVNYNCGSNGGTNFSAASSDTTVSNPALLQPRLTVKLRSFPESNGRQNWTAMLVRVDPWTGLVGSCGGITVARGELWNRVAYEAERTKLLIGERNTEPDILDYGDDIKNPEDWKGEVNGGRALRVK